MFFLRRNESKKFYTYITKHNLLFEFSWKITIDGFYLWNIRLCLKVLPFYGVINTYVAENLTQ